MKQWSASRGTRDALGRPGSKPHAVSDIIYYLLKRCTTSVSMLGSTETNCPDIYIQSANDPAAQLLLNLVPPNAAAAPINLLVVLVVMSR